MFKKLFPIFLLLLLTPSAVEGQVTVIEGHSLAFDYKDTEKGSFQIHKFEYQIDSGQWVSIGMPTSSLLTDTPSGYSTYLFNPAMSLGSHSIVVRACNDQTCSAPSIVLQLNVVVIPAPVNLRTVTPSMVIKGGE